MPPKQTSSGHTMELPRNTIPIPTRKQTRKKSLRKPSLPTSYCPTPRRGKHMTGLDLPRSIRMEDSTPMRQLAVTHSPEQEVSMALEAVLAEEASRAISTSRTSSAHLPVVLDGVLEDDGPRLSRSPSWSVRISRSRRTSPSWMLPREPARTFSSRLWYHAAPVMETV